MPKKRKSADEKRREAFKKLCKEAEAIRDPILEEMVKEEDALVAEMMELQKIIWKNPFHEERQRKYEELMTKYNILTNKMVIHMYDPNNPYMPMNTPISGRFFFLFTLTFV
jgi:hypothetical protein